MAHGWAVQKDANGKIDVRTVSDTRRAAIVNWLVTVKLLMVFAWTTDEDIEQMWWQYHGEAEIIQVTVERHH